MKTQEIRETFIFSVIASLAIVFASWLTIVITSFATWAFSMFFPSQVPKSFSICKTKRTLSNQVTHFVSRLIYRK